MFPLYIIDKNLFLENSNEKQNTHFTLLELFYPYFSNYSQTFERGHSGKY